MPATVSGIHLGPDTHANRPAANAAGQPVGSLYSCTDHGLVYITDGSSWTTWATLGGDVSSHLSDATDAHDASAISVLDTAANFTGTDVEAVLAELQDNIDGVSGGTSIQQIYAYPQHADLTGDSTHFTATTGWTNEGTAFDTLEIEGGSFAHLGITGASAAASILRRELTTDATGAFDFRTLIYPDAHFHAGGDVLFTWQGLDAGSRVFGVRLAASSNTGTITFNGYALTIFNNGDIAEVPVAIPYGVGITLRVTRDGSNLLRFYYGLGPTPGALSQVHDSNIIPIASSQTGTVTQIEYAAVVPAAANASAERHWRIDYFQTV